MAFRIGANGLRSSCASTGEEFILATVGLAQLLIRLLAFDEIGRLSRQNVEQSQVSLRRLMWAHAMRRDYADEPSAA